MPQRHSSAQVIEFASGRDDIPVYGGAERTAGVRMTKTLLIAVVEDDLLFRDSMKSLMKSLGYTVEAFPSAADFLASPHLIETAFLIAYLHMPSINRVEV